MLGLSSIILILFSSSVKKKVSPALMVLDNSMCTVPCCGSHSVIFVQRRPKLQPEALS